MQERDFWLGFSVFPGIGPILFQALLEKFGSAKDAWNGSDKDLRDVLKDKLTEKFVAFRKRYSLEDYARRLLVQGVSFLTLGEDGYPELLKQIKSPPFVLYVKGSIDIFDERGVKGDKRDGRAKGRFVGVVGTRKITSYGKDVTQMIVTELVSAGCVIVSGLAIGVDAVAHKTTIENHGKTIAVLGCGVDLCYPTANQALYNSILENGGAIVSEYPVGQPPSIGSFPSRNRIIAGLSEAVVVTEGAEDSGALITAQDAILNGRKVFAVPGQITSSLSKGPLKLLQEGAKMVTGGGDILSELGITKYEVRSKQRVIKGETKEEQAIIDLLQSEPLLFDEIVKMTKKPAIVLLSVLSMLEVKGVIRKNEGRFTLL